MQEAVNLLQQVGGPCYPLLFLKVGSKSWAPVGEEMLCSLVPGRSGTAAAVICDAEGNSKAMTAWVSTAKAGEYVKALNSKGLATYEGEVKLPV